MHMSSSAIITAAARAANAAAAPARALYARRLWES